MSTGAHARLSDPQADDAALVLPFAELDRASLPVAGGKAANLGELTRAGLPVPPGFVLTTAAYRAAGLALPRTADTQYRAGPRVSDGQPLLPGDLVFYGNPHGTIHHVGLYLGAGLMIDAPDFGQVVKTQPYLYPGADYAGATRPADRRQ